VQYEFLWCLHPGGYTLRASQALVEWFGVEDMLALGETELRRSQYMSAVEARKAAAHPLRSAQRSIEEQDAAIGRRDQEMRQFLREQQLLTVPRWLGCASLRPIPSYLQPLFGLFSVSLSACTCSLLPAMTSRLDRKPKHTGWWRQDNNMMTEDAICGATPMNAGLIRYTPPPSPSMGFFPRSAVYDVRPQVSHEAMPGHQMQLAVSQRHKRPVRRCDMQSS
jgi:hypothetical protein